MSERHKFMGRLEEKKLQVEKLKMKIEWLRDSMRNQLDPFDPVDELRLDFVAQQAQEAAEKQIELKALREKIRAIRKALGK